jgi:hypothetical protein
LAVVTPEGFADRQRLFLLSFIGGLYAAQFGKCLDFAGLVGLGVGRIFCVEITRTGCRSPGFVGQRRNLRLLLVATLRGVGGISRRDLDRCLQTGPPAVGVIGATLAVAIRGIALC